MSIQELVVKMSKIKMSAEDKKAVARTLPLLFNKTELLDGLAWCYGSFENEILNSGDAWEPSQSDFYNITNILLYLLNMETFKQSDDWEKVYMIIARRLFY